MARVNFLASPIISHLTEKAHIHTAKTAANYLPDMTAVYNVQGY